MMFGINYFWALKIAGISVLWLLLGSRAVHAQSLPVQPVRAAAAEAIAALTDGRYQFCSQPDSENGRDGAGVCLNFTKTADRVDGYYGYPHSDQFVCIRGAVAGNLITGEALVISWAGNQWTDIPESELIWDQEAHLTLSQGSLIRTSGSSDRTDWILFRRAILDASGFYPYSSPRMKAAAELCDW